MLAAALVGHGRGPVKAVLHPLAALVQALVDAFALAVQAGIDPVAGVGGQDGPGQAQQRQGRQRDQGIALHDDPPGVVG